jgi:hypothetical protein
MAELLLKQTTPAQNMTKPQTTHPAEEQKLRTNEPISAFHEDQQMWPHILLWKTVKDTCKYSL